SSRRAKGGVNNTPATTKAGKTRTDNGGVGTTLGKLVGGWAAARGGCTPRAIQAWRARSVSIQPAVFIRNGTGSPQMATRRNHLASASFLRHHSQTPHRASSSIAAP